MRFQLTIDMDNAAFEDDNGSVELERILRLVADRVALPVGPASAGSMEPGAYGLPQSEGLTMTDRIRWQTRREDAGQMIRVEYALSEDGEYALRRTTDEDGRVTIERSRYALEDDWTPYSDTFTEPDVEWEPMDPRQPVVTYQHAYGGRSTLCAEHAENPPASLPSLGPISHGRHLGLCDVCVPVWVTSLDSLGWMTLP